MGLQRVMRGRKRRAGQGMQGLWSSGEDLGFYPE